MPVKMWLMITLLAVGLVVLTGCVTADDAEVEATVADGIDATGPDGNSCTDGNPDRS